MIESCERGSFSVREKAASECRIPRFTASSGVITVEFVFGGSPDEDTQDRHRAQRPQAPGGLGILREEPQAHEDRVHRVLHQQDDELTNTITMDQHYVERIMGNPRTY